MSTDPVSASPEEILQQIRDAIASSRIPFGGCVATPVEALRHVLDSLKHRDRQIEELHKLVANLQPPAPTGETVCQEADRLVSHDRQETYGHPADNFDDTARGWEVILRLPTGSITPAQVGLCMTWLKIAREVHRPKRDNLVDGCGYLKTVAMCREREGV